ncbi:MAG: bifunctional phosphoribosylaminoimidazolecarboxamide formyltransferase/IMP cyclohydrolase [Bacteroidota bacterium]|nr:bifunctional phosphoribosylaminoimidazolecarboxamide formyltransferase/IMP cyclohydrolase [Bacteroidota bacterium]MDE2833257.1 bifunctional phosphoribosylaminoimidazolecarboxamide formyltransferase/IMP cyclohydrolase [Bacteroidota bacterium]
MPIEVSDVPPAPPFAPVRRALLSVYDKTGLVPFARMLASRGIELVSSGGTAHHLRQHSLNPIEVGSLTEHPEILGGRVKTLHPTIHGAILARRGLMGDDADLDALGIKPIDLVVVNLYPFEEAIAQPDVTDPVAAENIDIGGPALLRAAAKNFAHVTVISAPSEYPRLEPLLEAHRNSVPLEDRRVLAGRAFERTAAYDRAIGEYFRASDELRLRLPHGQALRYGENPHQKSTYYGDLAGQIEHLHGKPLSFNNLIDLDAALGLIDEFKADDPTVAILKHTNPCGAATAATLVEAWERAFATDTQSPFGGIVVMNRACTQAVAEAVDAIFTELIIAPRFEPGVLDFLRRKKNRRLILTKPYARPTTDMRSVLGGILCQDADSPAADDQMRTVTRRSPTDQETADLSFAWRICKHVKSNAIVYVRNRCTLGIGAGQMSRIDASEIAIAKGRKSGLDLTGCVVASDAFFPFADGLIAAAECGARAAVQPGGSIRDQEVIDAADARGIAMVFTGKRHFRH